MFLLGLSNTTWLCFLKWGDYPIPFFSNTICLCFLGGEGITLYHFCPIPYGYVLFFLMGCSIPFLSNTLWCLSFWWELSNTIFSSLPCGYVFIRLFALLFSVCFPKTFCDDLFSFFRQKIFSLESAKIYYFYLGQRA